MKRVHLLISQGWEPIGGASIACRPEGDFVIIQAMVKRPKESK